jgi:uncharacterized Tic20 family protein
MKKKISIKIRCLAASMHLFSIAPICLSIIGSSFKENSFYKLDWRLLIFPANVVLWMIIKENDAFIEQSGRDAINYTINALIMVVLVVTLGVIFLALFTSLHIVPAILIYFARSDAMPSDIHAVSGAFSLLAFLALIPYLIHSLIATIFAISGNCFCSRLIFPFIRSTSKE